MTVGLINLRIDESNAMSSDQRREECVFNNKTAGEWAQLATHYSDQLDIYKPALLRFENALQIVHCEFNKGAVLKTISSFSSIVFLIVCGFVWFCALFYPQRRRLQDMVRVDRKSDKEESKSRSHVVQLLSTENLDSSSSGVPNIEVKED